MSLNYINGDVLHEQIYVALIRIYYINGNRVMKFHYANRIMLHKMIYYLNGITVC